MLVSAERYSASLVLRPLVLPRNAFEGSALFSVVAIAPSGIDAFESYGVTPRAKYGFGSGELEGGVGLFLGQSVSFEGASNPERLQSVFVAGRFVIAPDTTLGAELTYFNFAPDVKRYAPRLVVANKQRFGSRSAIELSFAGGLDHTSIADLSGMSSSQDIVSGIGQIRVQAQMARAVALEARAAFGLFVPVGTDSGDNVLGQDYGVRMVLAATPIVDVLAGFDVISQEASVKLFTVGFAVRSVP